VSRCSPAFARRAAIEGEYVQHRPRRGAVQELPRRPDDVRHDDGLGAIAVRVLAADVAAQGVEEAVQLALRVMETPIVENRTNWLSPRVALTKGAGRWDSREGYTPPVALATLRRSVG
jgi:hypothetical protein